MKKTSLRTAVAGCLLIPCLNKEARALSAAELNVYSPAVEYHEKEVEQRTFISGKGADHEQGRSFSLGYAPTSFWEAEVYEVLHKDPGQVMVADKIELENRFQLAPAGRFWLDPGLLLESEFPQQNGNPGEVRALPILEKQLGSFVATGNAGLEWQWGDGMVQGTTFNYAGKVEYLLNPYFSPAVEIFGEPGVIGNWQRADTQQHQLGPAFYGSWRWGESRQKLKYSAASLYGMTHASPDWTVVFRFELEF